MNLRAILEKYSFPVGAVYNTKPKGGVKLDGEAAVFTVSQTQCLQLEEFRKTIEAYVREAETRISNG